MSELADSERRAKRSWALPGGFHDYLVGFLKIGLPAAVGVLLAYLALAPMSRNKDASFLLDKNKVEQAQERMQVRSARYHGQDNDGRPFVINAEAAVQETSARPIVEIDRILVRVMTDSGPAIFQAPRARYNLETQQVTLAGPVSYSDALGYRVTGDLSVVDLRAQTLVTDRPVTVLAPDGRRVESGAAMVRFNQRVVTSARPVTFTAPDGYRVETSAAAVDLNAQTMVGNGGTAGRMPLGSFTAGRMQVDMARRQVVLSGRARLHIDQGALR